MASFQQTNTPSHVLFLKKFAKMLKQLDQVTETNAKAIYALVKEDLDYSFSSKVKKVLLTNMKEISKVEKVEKDPSDCYFIGLHSGGDKCLVGFSYKGRSTLETLMKKASEQKMKYLLIDLTAKDEVNENLLPSYLTSQSKVSRPAQKQNNNNVTYGNNSTNFEDSFDLQELSPSLSEISVTNYPQGNTFSSYQGSWQYQNTNALRMSRQPVRQNVNSGGNLKRNDFESDIEKVLNELEDKEVYSDGVVADYGYIPFSEFFEQLISRPDDPTNRKWIGYFLGEFSAKWSNSCLVAIRTFIQKHNQQFRPKKFTL